MTMNKSIFEEQPEMRALQLRSGEFQTREDGGELTIEGYFAVFNSNYEIWEGASESIAPGAFDSSISGDIRALTNHDTTLVLGRTKANTLELKTDSHGLWGRVRINPNDSEAMNTYERVKRGDVDQCSIGFLIRFQETDFREDGSIHWTITDVELFEVSVCTFPAYEETSVSARRKDAAEIRSRQLEAWKLQMKDRLTKSNQEEESNA
jgi:hypothetical protein